MPSEIGITPVPHEVDCGVYSTESRQFNNGGSQHIFCFLLFSKNYLYLNKKNKKNTKKQKKYKKILKTKKQKNHKKNIINKKGKT